jgi:hypothetical protein
MVYRSLKSLFALSARYYALDGRYVLNFDRHFRHTEIRSCFLAGRTQMASLLSPLYFVYCFKICFQFLMSFTKFRSKFEPSLAFGACDESFNCCVREDTEINRIMTLKETKILCR